MRVWFFVVYLVQSSHYFALVGSLWLWRGAHLSSVQNRCWLIVNDYGILWPNSWWSVMIHWFIHWFIIVPMNEPISKVTTGFEHGSFWKFDIARALSSFWSHRIALVVLRCASWCRSRHLPVFLWVTDRSSCGAARMLISLAEPSRQCVRIRLLSLWRGAHVDLACTNPVTLCLSRCGAGLFSQRQFSDNLASFRVRSWRGRSISESLVEVLLRRACEDLVFLHVLVYRALREDLVGSWWNPL